MKSLPKLNWTSEALGEAFAPGGDSVVAHWLMPPLHLVGWRIDVGNMTGRLGTQDTDNEVAALIQARVLEINQGAMTGFNFTRSLWQWLGNPAAHVDFFGTPLSGPPKVAADVVLVTYRGYSSAFHWSVRNAGMNALKAHDTARAASVMIPGGPMVAAALSILLTGIAVMFASNEHVLESLKGESTRTLLPWDEPDRIDTDLRANYVPLPPSNWRIWPWRPWTRPSSSLAPRPGRRRSLPWTGPAPVCGGCPWWGSPQIF